MGLSQSIYSFSKAKNSTTTSLEVLIEMAPTPVDSTNLSSDSPKTCEKEMDQFDKTFETILQDIYEINGDPNANFSKAMTEITEYNQACMEYNVPHGKKLRGKMVVMVYQSLVPEATEEQLKLARILGWCAESLQAAYLVADDIMDNGETRRGQLCWYRYNDIGLTALNDSFYLEHVAYQILLKHFGHLDCCSELLNLLLTVTYKTILGQGLDINTSKERNFDKYNDQLYQAIVTYKTGYYTVYLPVVLGMVYAGISQNVAENKEIWKNVEKITLDVGRLFQIQDDYFDCFSDDTTIGKKAGSDVEEGKCTWLFVKAKQLLENNDKTKTKFEILKENYGKTDSKNVEVVKHLYKEINLPEVFSEYQESVHKDISDDIKELKNEKLEKVLTMFLKMLYKRVY